MTMSMHPIDKCPIWPDFTAKMLLMDDQGLVRLVESVRAGGKYEIDVLAEDLAAELDDQTRARLTTWLLDQHSMGVCSPRVTPRIIEYAKTRRPLQPWERAERLLRFIAQRMDSIGDNARVDGNDPKPYAWSESSEKNDVFYLFGYLQEMGWVDGHFFADSGFSGRVTINGYAKLSDQAANSDSSQAFVAMWFHDSMNQAYNDGIKPAIEAAGFNPLRIDQKPDANKIDDEINAEIRRSRFLVADFTQGDSGTRGSVYFEAGYALGLGIPVIFTCRNDKIGELHFDTRQYAHIVWENAEQLRDNLKNRILARIGEGPNAVVRPFNQWPTDVDVQRKGPD